METEKIDSWSLIQKGEFLQACQAADNEYEKTKNILVLRNKVYAFFLLKRYEQAAKLTQSLISLSDGKTDVDFISCGIANWLMGKRSFAIDVWQKARTCTYKDAAGGIDIEILLYYASLKISDNNLKKERIKHIKRLLKSKKSINWPAPLGKFIIKDTTKDEMFSYVSNVPVLRERNLCQAYFVLAIQALEDKDNNSFKNNLEDSINYGEMTYIEQFYYLAKGEVEAGIMLKG